MSTASLFALQQAQLYLQQDPFLDVVQRGLLQH